MAAQGVFSSESSQSRATGSSTMRAAVISIGGDLFTIDLKSVQEVFVVESITPVPGMPSGLVGVTNLRGTVIPLLDLRPMFRLEAVASLRYAIVVQHLSWQVGLLVDAVPEIRTIAKDQFLPAPAGTGEGAVPFVSTVVKLENRLRGVLETSMVLSHFEGKG
ncbi:MAG: chemotaxis protein CheW [Nitrospiraceae bacterium]